MATGFTDFSEYTAGALPSDWTLRFNAVAGQILVAEVSGATGGKTLRIARAPNSPTAYVGASWDDIDADPDRDDVELVCKFRFIAITGNLAGQESTLFVRGSGTGLTNSYLYGAGATRSVSPYRRLTKRTNGSRATLGGGGDLIDNNVWVWARVRANGTSIKSKLWLDSESEPAGWDVEVTDSGITTAGFCGFVSGAFTTEQNDNVEVDVFGYGTNGDTAPKTGSADETAPTLTTPSATQTGATTADLAVTTDEGNGTLYWVVTQSATSPSIAQVQAGQDHTGTTGADSGSQSVSTTGTQTAGATGLTAETTYYAHFQHTDAASNDSAVVTSASFTTSAVPLDPPLGVASVVGVIASTTTAEVTYSYSASDQTGFEYRINDGAPAAIGASPATITGLTAATDYDAPGLQVRAVNAQGAGAWSTAFPFSTQAEPPAEVKGVSIQLYDGSTEQASITGVHALWWDTEDPTGAPTYETTTASTDSVGVLTLDLDASTSLELSGTGFLLLWKPETTVQDSPAFAGRMAIVDIS